MNAPLASPTAETFSLKRRIDGGGTPAMNYWGCASEYGVLTDVLLGKADHIKHLSTSSLSRKYLREAPCNIEVAKKQPKAQVRIKGRNGRIQEEHTYPRSSDPKRTPG